MTGRQESVLAYLGGIDAHPALGEMDRVTLLSMGSEQGVQALAYGLMKGKPEPLAILLEWITRSDLSTTNQRRLLSAETARGMPALADAILKGATRNVKVFTEAVLASALKNIDKEDVLRLGRWGADLRGSPALEAYQGSLRVSSLPQSAQELLLADVRR